MTVPMRMNQVKNVKAAPMVPYVGDPHHHNQVIANHPQPHGSKTPAAKR
jgi:hypothetical protein